MAERRPCRRRGHRWRTWTSLDHYAYCARLGCHAREETEEGHWWRTVMMGQVRG